MDSDNDYELVYCRDFCTQTDNDISHDELMQTDTLPFLGDVNIIQSADFNEMHPKIALKNVQIRI